MGQPAVYNNQNLLYGTVLIKVGAETYIAEDISMTRPTVVVSREDELGAPSGEVGIPDWQTGTATLQISSGGSVPNLGTIMTASFSGSVEEHCWINEVGQTFAQRDLRKVNISFRKVV